MSVQWIPVLVMRTLIVPTLTVLTSVTVSKDLMEMGKFVKVNLICRSYKLILRLHVTCFA